MELEELMPKLKELEPEAPQCAKLLEAGLLVEYQQPAGPLLVPEEDERHEAWLSTNR